MQRCEEVGDARDPIILVQDYHLALVPRLIKEKRRCRVEIFWHIPWRSRDLWHLSLAHDLLDGLLGADLIGFHIESHCRNFLRLRPIRWESRIEWSECNVTAGRL